MTVKIDSIEPNIFPEIEYLDAAQSPPLSQRCLQYRSRITALTDPEAASRQIRVMIDLSSLMERSSSTALLKFLS